MDPFTRGMEGNVSQKKSTEGERQDNIELTTAEVRRSENSLKGYNREARTRTRTHQGERGGVEAENWALHDKMKMKPEK